MGLIEEAPEQMGIETFFCFNEKCPDHGLRGNGNLKFRGHSDKTKKIRLIHCYRCGKRFSERKGTALFRSKLTKEKYSALANLLREGNGTRATARMTGVSKQTVTRCSRKLGDHADKMHDELVGESPNTREVQLDEKWGFVGKKQGKLTEEELESGDLGNHWDHVAIDAEHKLVLSLKTGSRSAEYSKTLVEDVKRRTKHRNDIYYTSDEFEGYKSAIAETYGKRKRKYKQPNKQATNPQWELFDLSKITIPIHRFYKIPDELVFATVRKERKNGKVIKVFRELVFGYLRVLQAHIEKSKVSQTINTSHIERVNGTDRGQNSRKRRRTLGFSKSKKVHDAVGKFVMFSYNFCWEVETLTTTTRRTPAMAAGLTDHKWTTSKWIQYPVVA